MSVADIFDEMESYNRRLENSFKRALSIAFTQAESTAEHVGRYLNEKNTARAPWDFFPELFREEKELYERETVKREMEKARANRHAYAKEVKKRREAGMM